jgi:FHA domain/Domain of unknown function (DUF1707)
VNRPNAADNRVVGRASDHTREQAVATLRGGLVEGRLGTETFVSRVDAAYRAKTHNVLAGLTRDLPRRRRRLRALLDLVAPVDGLAPGIPAPLHPPDVRSGHRLTLGRDNACDYAISDATVSGRHAELERTDDGWMIRDLKSRNGTRVNGWRVGEKRLCAGDELALGAALFVFAPPGESPAR